MGSEFDKLKGDAEQYAQQHPEQVKEGEQAVEKKFGIGEEEGAQQTSSQPVDGQGSDGQQASGGNDAPGSTGSGQDSGRQSQ
jgi:hypothetical protein